MNTSRHIGALYGLFAVLISFTAQAQSDMHEYVYCDNGMRCVRAPCPSRSAKDLQTGEVIRGARLDLDGLSETDRKRSDLQDALYRGTLVLGGQRVSRPSPTLGQGDTLIIARIVRPATLAERQHCSSRR